MILLTGSLISHRMLRFGTGLGVLAISMIAGGLGSVGAQEDATKPEYFTTKVKPILETNCSRCHMGVNHRGGLNIDTKEGMLKGGHDGTVLVPGDPDKSLIVKLIKHEGPPADPMPMPPNKPKLSDEDIAVVAKWVKAGAAMP